jgi:hypothetical protein
VFFAVIPFAFDGLFISFRFVRLLQWIILTTTTTSKQSPRF